MGGLEVLASNKRWATRADGIRGLEVVLFLAQAVAQKLFEALERDGLVA